MSMCHITIQVIASLDFAQSCLRSGITYTIDALVSDDWNEWMDYKFRGNENRSMTMGKNWWKGGRK